MKKQIDMPSRDALRALYPPQDEAYMRAIRRTLAALEGEREASGKVRRRIPFAAALAAALLLALACTAVAAGLGIFGSFSGEPFSEMSATRLQRLDAVSDETGASVTLTAPGEQAGKAQPADDVQAALARLAGRQFTLTVDQAYGDGRKLYYSYTLHTDAPQTVFSEGRPAGIDAWDSFVAGARFDEVYGFYDAGETERVAQWLNGHDAAYVIRESVSLGDGAVMDGEVLEVYDSNWAWKDENTLTGFEEVRLPDGREVSGEVTVQMHILYSATVYYQDASGVYWKHLAPEENRGILVADVTLPVTGKAAPLAGKLETGEYTVNASLYVSDVDVYGTVTVTAAQGSVAFVPRWDYALLAGDEELHNLDGAASGNGDGTYTLGVRYDLPENKDKLILRPVGLEDSQDDIELVWQE